MYNFSCRSRNKRGWCRSSVWKDTGQEFPNMIKEIKPQVKTQKMTKRYLYSSYSNFWKETIMRITKAAPQKTITFTGAAIRSVTECESQQWKREDRRLKGQRKVMAHLEFCILWKFSSNLRQKSFSWVLFQIEYAVSKQCQDF